MREALKNGTTVTIRPECDIVASTLNQIRPELKAAVDGGATKLIIDFTGIDMIDSMGIGIVIATYNSLKKQSGALELTNVSAEIANLLKNMRLNQYFTITERAELNPN